MMGGAVLLFITGAGRYALGAMLLRKFQVRAASVADCRIDWARRHRVKLTAITTKVAQRRPGPAGGVTQAHGDNIEMQASPYVGSQCRDENILRGLILVSE